MAYPHPFTKLRSRSTLTIGVVTILILIILFQLYNGLKFFSRTDNADSVPRIQKAIDKPKGASAKENIKVIPKLALRREKPSDTVVINTVRDMISRIIPGHVSLFELQIIDKPSEEGTFDVFELSSKDSANSKFPITIVIKGNNGVSLASGLHHYLKYYCYAQITWGASQLNIPSPPPSINEKLRITTQHKYRYYMNTCTHGYSAAWWDWERWEKEIDWMALNGINAPLAFTGQEYVWKKTYEELDISIKGLFTGPAFLPWNRMGNLYGWAGPLPDHFIEKQFQVALKILERERTLGMTPVLPGYAGYVPPKYKTKYPDSKVSQLWNWGGFPGTLHLNPLDPMFQIIGSTFLTKLIQLMGTDHLYNADPFNEELPPSNDPTYLASVGDAIYSSMKSVDQDSVWVMQGWFLLHTGNFWRPPQAQALLNSIPKENLVVLDLWAEVLPMWTRNDKFYGHYFVWCMLHNFGGRPGLYGKLHTLSKDISTAKKSSGELMAGIGLSMEAIENNPVVYDMVTDMTWRNKNVNVDEWVQQYAKRRYGVDVENMKRAWKLLQDSVYSCETRQMSGTGSVIAARPDFTIRDVSAGPLELYFEKADVGNAWKLFLQSEELKDLETFNYDLIDVGVQCLSIAGNEMYAEYVKSVYNKDLKAMKLHSKQMKTLMTDMDELLATNVNFMLGPWTHSARQWGSKKSEVDLMERNARYQITSWGEPSNPTLLQYAYKLWSDLVVDFYLPRWELFFTIAEETVTTKRSIGEGFQSSGWRDKIEKLEHDWIHENKEYPTIPTGNTFEVSKRLFKKYSDHVI
ncbi:alpha-N-acetylglucosaminidase [Acrasis kona]|uniref:Alpha-N-acetylglucosaminidase n=1 Tax=Acrasis kona TaxID=1008807 RepID=A0AAW2YJD7_9EUKA